MSSPLPYRPCVGVMLFNASGHVFAGQRIDNHHEAWQMPQGGVDAGEAPAEAALRELKEEIGTDKARIIQQLPSTLRYDLPEELQGKLWGGRYRGQEQWWFLMEFLGSDDDINIATPHPEFRAWEWVEAPSLPGRIVPFKRGIYEQVVAAFHPVIQARITRG